MLKPEQRPSADEAKKETEKRLKIAEMIRPKLEPFTDALIIVGSLAFSKNYCIAPSSDIDLLVLIEPQKINEILKCDLFEDNEWTRFATSKFNEKVIQHFTLTAIINDVTIEFHFWNKEYEYKASRLEIDKIKMLSRKSSSSSIHHQDFFGRIIKGRELGKPFGIGYLHDYPIYTIVDKHFVVYEPIHNLIMLPDILFTKDVQLYKNINILWKKLVKRLSEENPGVINLSKINILNAMPGNWNLPKNLKEKLQDRTEKELFKLGIKYKY